jgi:hypothetical protein
MIITEELLQLEIFKSKLWNYIYITGDELIKRIYESNKSEHTYADNGDLILFQIPEISIYKPVTVESEYKYYKILSEITNIGPQGLFRLKLYYSLSSLEITELIYWEHNQWSEENLIENLQALQLFRTELTLKSMWNVIFDNPGKDWSKLYITLLS